VMRRAASFGWEGRALVRRHNGELRPGWPGLGERTCRGAAGGVNRMKRPARRGGERAGGAPWSVDRSWERGGGGQHGGGRAGDGAARLATRCCARADELIAGYLFGAD
jgi:hypothetical protein